MALVPEPLPPVAHRTQSVPFSSLAGDDESDTGVDPRWFQDANGQSPGGCSMVRPGFTGDLFLRKRRLLRAEDDREQDEERDAAVKGAKIVAGRRACAPSQPSSRKCRRERYRNHSD
jgi:hypothetical protein